MLIAQKTQVRSWLKIDSAAPVDLPFCSGTIATCTYKCPDKETANEDAAVVIELSADHVVMAVADGMGGHNAGDRAAQAAIESLMKHCQSTEPEGSIRSAIVDAIEDANREVLSWGIGAGATLVVAEYYRGTVRIIHVGDAGAILMSNRGSVKFFAVPHAPVAMAVEVGILNEQEALEHDDRNIINNCIGSTEMKIEVGPELSMAARDTLLLASDGLFDNLTTSAIVNVVRAGHLNHQLTTLVNTTNSQMLRHREGFGKPDDLTVCCFRQPSGRHSRNGRRTRRPK